MKKLYNNNYGNVHNEKKYHKTNHFIFMEGKGRGGCVSGIEQNSKQNQIKNRDEAPYF